MSYRELFVFVRHLPQDSWTQTIIRDEKLDELVNPEPAEESSAEPKFGPWSLLNYQMAALTDAVNLVYYASAVGKFKDVDEPVRTPRPGLRAVERRPRNPEHVVRYLEEMRAARRAAS
jgi:hypothetical protein